ncbi:MAG TPA: response regulator transcription factor [Candidatus Scybalomonas excrementigallinarum]|nr:response regulator transcription factor [Candidatus Scybalomonas excrementigallinarum]
MIYFVDDDDSIRELIIYTLNSQGIEAEGFAKPSEFWKAMEERIPTLILLDIMLPEEDGISILKKIRSKSLWKKIPVIMLTAKGSEFDTVLGLDSGADDYVPKPFRMMELLSRIRAHLRRNDEVVEENKVLKLGILSVDSQKHIVKVGEDEIVLTLKEFDLLHFLLENKGIVLTRAQILDRIWGYEFDGESRTVDVHIRTLRQKLKDAGKYIETVRGVGYKLEERIDDK